MSVRLQSVPVLWLDTLNEIYMKRFCWPALLNPASQEEGFEDATVGLN